MRKKPHWVWWTKIRRKYVLHNYNRVSLDDMADLWECSVGTIYRDIRELRKHGMVDDYTFKMFLKFKREGSENARYLASRWMYLPLRRKLKRGIPT